MRTRWSSFRSLAGGVLLLASAALPVVAQSPSQSLGICHVFPADNVWNARVDQLPVDPNSAAYIASAGPTGPLHPDFSMPFVTVPGSQHKVPIVFSSADVSDPGPYPIPPDAPIEGGPSAPADSDRHVLVVDRDACMLYEVFLAFPQSDGSWTGGNGAIFDLLNGGLRTRDETSADAAGLPIFPGLVRYDEAASGSIRHAIRCTMKITQEAYIWPARHYASHNTSTSVPPMGQRFRLNKNFNISTYSPMNQAILQALKTYGMILADNGSNWFITGAQDSRWNDADLNLLKQVHGSDFEAVDVSALMIAPDMARAQPQIVLSVRRQSVARAAMRGLAQATTIEWNAPGHPAVELRAIAPDGPVIASGAESGSTPAGPWAAAGRRFFLVDQATGSELASVTLDERPDR